MPAANSWSALSCWRDGRPPSSEASVLSYINSVFPRRSGHVPLGRGHDCAELEHSGPLALSTDLFIEGSHFSRAWFTPEEVGAKALNSALSDLAASGAVPLGFSLGLQLPPDLGAEPLRALLSAMAEAAKAADCVLSGGDIARAERLGFSLTVWGGQADAPFLRRAPARPGMRVFLAGEAGLARAGLLALKRFGREEALRRFPKACAAHLHTRPLLREGQIIARLARDEGRTHNARPPALMDLSDGLARDLPRLLGPLGADLDFARNDVPEEVYEAARYTSATPDEFFLLGGEDYALLGICTESLWRRIANALPNARLIGKTSREEGLRLRGEALTLQGFDHFEDDWPDFVTGSSRASDLKEFAWRKSVQNFGNDIVRAGREAWKAGLAAGFNGNISLRLQGEDNAAYCLITGSGSAKARLRPHDLCLMRLPDCAYVYGPPSSSERAVHAAIYTACPESRAVLHVHPPALLALCLALPEEKRLALPLPEAENYRARLAWTAFQPPGSKTLAEAVAAAAKNFPAVWMERHGLVVHGPDLEFALSLAEELEQLARVQLAALGARGKRFSPPGGVS